MNIPATLIGALGLLALATGCTTALAPEQTEAIGPPFNEALKDGYIRLASAELDDFDPSRYVRFRDKARAAMIGDTVQPDRVGERTLSSDKRSEALAIRGRLVRQLEGGARERSPDRAAEAQVSFDCWLGTGRESASLCKESLVAALEDLEARTEPVATRFEVLFPSGRATLDASAEEEIERAAARADAVDAQRVDVVGFADRSGSPEINLQLSVQRAKAVGRALRAAGVPVDLLGTAGSGEIGGSDDPKSRRVDITVVP